MEQQASLNEGADLHGLGKMLADTNLHDPCVPENRPVRFAEPAKVASLLESIDRLEQRSHTLEEEGQRLLQESLKMLRESLRLLQESQRLQERQWL